MNLKPSVLHELWVANVGGYAGIPQDTRIIFEMLASSDQLTAAGLLYLSSPTFPIRKTISKGWQAEHFYAELVKQQAPKKPTKKSLPRYLILAIKLFNVLFKKRFSLSKLNYKNLEVLWNSYFSKSISADQKDLILQQDFYFSEVSGKDFAFSSHFGREVFLNTEGFDFVLFPDVRAVTVSPSTKKIIRYHDSFAFICPDFFQTNHSLMHLNNLKSCVKDSYFVCNSLYTKNVLVSIFPELADKAFVIPLAIQSYKKQLNLQKLFEICLRRLSTQICEKEELQPIKNLLTEKNPFEYILSLSTLEPRKNYVNLIRAWELYNHRNEKPIKLMIVANKGWLSQEIEALMRPHIQSGNIIHLSGVPTEEIAYLYSHAKLFAYLSFIEGFGIPPLEAMQCECPVLASNNETHCWSMEEAAYYVNPYSVDEIAAGMQKLLAEPDSEQLRQTFAKKGLVQVQRYTIDNIKLEWEKLFKQLQHNV